jgi:hypothetical protein
MKKIEHGQVVRVPCEVKPGAFPEEALVTIQTAEGPVSGLVNRGNLIDVRDGSAYILGVVKDIGEDTITVLLQGSFFTTTGLTYIKTDWAKSHLQAVA